MLLHGFLLFSGFIVLPFITWGLAALPHSSPSFCISFRVRGDSGASAWSTDGRDSSKARMEVSACFTN